MAVRVQYTTVIVSYTDTLTEGGGVRGEWQYVYIYVLPQLLCLTWIL